jgi:hypothetical protein
MARCYVTGWRAAAISPSGALSASARSGIGQIELLVGPSVPMEPVATPG